MGRAPNTTLAGAAVCARTLFASVYEALDDAKHRIIINFADPGDPLCLPQFTEIDGVALGNWSQPKLKLEVIGTTNDKYYHGFVYEPSPGARNAYSAQVKRRNTRATPNRMGAKDVAAWIEEILKRELSVTQREQEYRLKREAKDVVVAEAQKVFKAIMDGQPSRVYLWPDRDIHEGAGVAFLQLNGTLEEVVKAYELLAPHFPREVKS